MSYQRKLTTALLAVVIAAFTVIGEDSNIPDAFAAQVSLCSAIASGDVMAVEGALGKGARLDTDCPQEMTPPLLTAVDSGNVAIVTLLLERGADVNQKDKGVSATALHYAALNGDVAMVALLLKRGANVNAITDEGLSALALAVSESDATPVVESLIAAGADVNAFDEQGDTVLDTAILKKHRLVAALLESKGAKRGEVPGMPQANDPAQPAPAQPAQATAPPTDAAGKRTSDSQLLFKGLHLGMNAKDAALTMLKYGLPPGGSSEWTEAYSLPMVRGEYNDAGNEHYQTKLSEKMRENGVKSASALARKLVDPEIVAQADKRYGLDRLDAYPTDPADAFLSLWATLMGRPLLSEADRFPSLKDYLAQHYPQGVPYRLGGPWSGDIPLTPEETRDGTRLLKRDVAETGWSIWADKDDRVKMIQLNPGCVNALFNSGDLGAIEFVQSFADAYAIPSFDTTSNRTDPLERYFTDRAIHVGWEYVEREHGWGIRIDQHKMLTVVRLAPAKELKFD